MNKKLFVSFLVLIGLALLAGCGGGGGSSPSTAAPTNTLHMSQECIDCHEGATNLPATPGSGGNVASEWKNSVHNTSNSSNVSKTGAACTTCHGRGYLHPFGTCNRCHSIGGTGSNPTHNPDADGVCGNCHSKTVTTGFTASSYDGITLDTNFLHFSSGRHANYVATNYQRKCSKCHNPHDTTFGKVQRQQWARSGHGNTLSNARLSSDFKTRGSSASAENNFGGPFCVRCHTTTGFTNYVESNFTDIQALPDSDGVRNNFPANARTTYVDTSREVTGCNACHDDARSESDPLISGKSSYSGRVRRVPQVVSYYNFSSTGLSTANPSGKTQRYKLPSTISYANLPASNFVTPSGGNWGLQFKDFGLSNVCVACHSGREIGMMIKVASVGNTEVNAALPGQSLPLNFNISQSSVDPHDRAAASNLNGISGFEFYSDSAKYANPNTFLHDKLGLAPNYYGDPQRKGNGPCVTCHVANNTKSHLFLPVDSSDNVISTTCSGCHASPPDIAAQKEGLAAALKALLFMAIHADSYSTNAALGASYDNRFQLTINTIRKETTSPLSGIVVPANIAAFSTSASGTKWSVFGRWLLSPNPAGVGNGTTFVDFIVPGSGNPLNGNATDAITAGAYTMGASFNYTLISNDPGAFAHNPTYVKRLIYDSIDWLDNGQMDGGGSVVTSLTNALNTLAATAAYPGGGNPAVFASSNGATKSVTFIVYSGRTTRTYSQFTFTTDDLNKAITFLCGNTGVRP